MLSCPRFERQREAKTKGVQRTQGGSRLRMLFVPAEGLKNHIDGILIISMLMIRMPV